MIDLEQLRCEAEPFGVTLTDRMAEQLDAYAELLVEKNKVMNLTGITEPSAMVTRHFADSLSFFAAAHPEQGASLIDVGSGAGFPGMVLAIVRPDMRITLMDGTAKRIRFLQEVAEALDLPVTCIHARAEDLAKDSAHREHYDFVTARAVSELRTLAEYCLGFVKVGGRFVALKGKDTDTEVSSAANALATMGGQMDGQKSLFLADGSERTLLTVKKISHTSPKYPRVSAQIAKKPL